jgi:tRNA(adenine34) deaminase
MRGIVTPAELLKNKELIEEYMQLAIEEAQLSLPHEVPIGALIVDSTTENIIGRAHNQREANKSAIGHAEISAIEQACSHIDDWRLDNCIIFSTLEPCVMCAGALSQARIGAVVFGAEDKLFGAAGSIYNLFADPRLPANPPVLRNICGQECSTLLKDFFASKR